MIQRYLAAAALALAASVSFAQTKEIKIGVIYDLTGPLAAGGSYAGYLGTKYAIDMINEKGWRRRLQDQADLRRRAVQA